MSSITPKPRVVRAIAVTALILCQAGRGSAEDSGVLYGVRVLDQQLVFRSVDLAGSGPELQLGRLQQPAEERLTAIFQNKDRGIGLIRTSVKEQSSRRALVRMVGIPERVVDASAWEIAGLSSTYAISSIVIPDSGLPIALISHYSDTPAFWLATIDLASSRVSPQA